jgi:hypothetical protein
LWFSKVEEPSPIAPDFIASRNSAVMRAISSAVAARCEASAPITTVRIVECDA